MSVRAMTWAWDQGVPTSEKLVLLCLADHADHDGVCWPGQDRVAEKTGLSERTVRRAVQSLIDRGLMVGQRRRRDDGTLAGYTYSLLVIDHRTQWPVDAQPPDTVSSATGHSGRSITVKENRHIYTSEVPVVGVPAQRVEDVIDFSGRDLPPVDTSDVLPLRRRAA